MKPNWWRRYGVVHWLLAIVLSGSCWLSASAYLQLEHAAVAGAVRAEAEADLTILADSVERALSRLDYQEAAEVLSAWGRRRESIGELHLIASNGFDLGHFVRPGTSVAAMRLNREVVYPGGGQTVLEMVVRQHVDDARVRRLTWLVWWAAGALSALWLLLLWADFRRRRVVAQQDAQAHALELKRQSLDASTHELARLQSLCREILDADPAVVAAVDSLGRVTEWNAQASNLTRYKRSEALGRSMEVLMPLLGDQKARLERAIAKRRAERTPRLATVSGGSVRYSDVLIQPLSDATGGGALVRVEDVSLRVRFAQTMAQSEKMASLGGLAAGVAGEINSPLSGVLQNCQNVLRRLSPDLQVNRQAAAAAGVDLDRMSDYLGRRNVPGLLELVRESAERAARIVTDMLAFSHRGGGEFEKVAAVDLMETALRLCASDYDLKKKYNFDTVQVLREFSPDLPLLHCDRTRIEQVLLNLIRNAIQAMALGETPAPRRIVLRLRLEGGGLLFEVEDNGPGMNEEVSKRVFDPFFTTRPPSVGSGLGLSVAHFIVTDQHLGDLTLDTRPGAGSRFTVRLPVKPERPSHAGGFVPLG